MTSFRSVPLTVVAFLAVGCRPVTRPGVQVQDTRSVLLETVATRLPDGAVIKTTYPHGSRNTRYAAVLIVGDYTAEVADDEDPGSERLLASWADGLGAEKMLTMRVTDDAPTEAVRRERILQAWETLSRSRLVNRKSLGLLVQGDAFYTVAPLLGRLRPRALVLAGCPARPFREVARERALQALKASDGSLPQSSVLARLGEWERGELPGGPFWSATFGDAPKGYYDGSFGWKLPAGPAGLPVFVLSGDPQGGGSTADAALLARNYSAKTLELPLTNRHLKPQDDRSYPGPSDGIVPDALEAVTEFLVPILAPTDLRES